MPDPTLDMKSLALILKQIRMGFAACAITVVATLPVYGSERLGSSGRSLTAGPESELVRFFHENVVDIGIGRKFDRELFRSRLVELVEIDLPEGTKKRRELARAWKAAAAVVHMEDGDSPFFLEMLEVALAMDPGCEILATEVALHRERLAIVEARAFEAAAARAARQNSGDSDIDGGVR